MLRALLYSPVKAFGKSNRKRSSPRLSRGRPRARELMERSRAQCNGVSVSSLALNRHEQIKRCDALPLEANGITRATRDTLGDHVPCTVYRTEPNRGDGKKKHVRFVVSVHATFMRSL